MQNFNRGSFSLTASGVQFYAMYSGVVKNLARDLVNYEFKETLL